MGLARKLTRARLRAAEQITEEERGALTRMVEEIGVLERKANHARAKLDAYALDLEAKYKLRKGDQLNTDTGAITRRTSGPPAAAT